MYVDDEHELSWPWTDVSQLTPSAVADVTNSFYSGTSPLAVQTHIIAMQLYIGIVLFCREQVFEHTIDCLVGNNFQQVCVRDRNVIDLT